MRFFFSVLGILIFTLGCKQTPKEGQVASSTPKVAIASTNALYEDLKGNPIALADYKGKKVILNYWATWCKPCIEEMPAFERLQEILPEKEYVLLFASDQSFKVIRNFKKSKTFNLNFIRFNGTWKDEKIYALPVTKIFNNKGVLVAKYDGAAEWDSPEMIQKIKSL